MDPQEVAEIRRMVERCLEGQEPVEVVASQLATLAPRYFEAGYQASLRGEAPLPGFMPEPRTTTEKQRLRALCEALLDRVSNELPVVEYLPLDEDGAA